MLNRWICSLMLVGSFAVPLVRADEPVDANRAALQKLNDFIGEWNGNGGPDKPKLDAKDVTWKETLNWGWKFKGNDSWMSLDVKDGKYISAGELRYKADKKAYEFTLIDAKKQKQVFLGNLDAKGYLNLERIEPGSGETQLLTMNIAGDGARFIYRLGRKAKGRTVFSKDYQVAASKEGESLGSADKKNECIVTGGLGTMVVSHMGKSYYVCCTGCRDAFMENPDKYVKEWEAKKKK